MILSFNTVFLLYVSVSSALSCMSLLIYYVTKVRICCTFASTLSTSSSIADFLSSDLSTIPIEWTGSTFTADSSIDMSDASLIALTADEIHVTSRRRRDLSEQSNLPNSLRVKRQTAGQHSMRRPMGDLVNSGPNDAQMNLNVSGKPAY